MSWPPPTASPLRADARRGRRALAAATALVLAGLGLGLRAGPAQASVALPTGFADLAVAGGLDHPTAFAFLPDGRVLVAEQKTGAIRLVVGGSVAPQPIGVVPNLNISGDERGLLAIAVDPAWPTRPFVYLHATMQGGMLQLLRFTATGTLTNPTSFDLTLGDEYVVLDGITDLNAVHNGGALRFAPDGRLFYSVGDDYDACSAQDSTTLKGALLHLDVRALSAGPGGPPPRALLICPDNPWATGPDSSAALVWAYGFRNPFRMTIDPRDGTPYVSDVGDNTWEELDRVTPGFNGGWPFREGPAVYSWPGCSEPGGSGHGSYDAPIDYYDHGTGIVIVAAGVVRYRFGSAWPLAWDGNVLYADYYAGFMHMVGPIGGGWQRIAAGGQPDPSDFATGLITPVDFAWGPNGDLYWLQQDDGSGSGHTGILHRIHPSNPVAVPPALAPSSLALAAAPNPAAGGMALRFTLPATGPVRLAVFDLDGRVIARLVDGTLGAGAHQVHWDGRDRAAAPVRAGVYLARLETGSGVRTIRFVRLD